MAKGVAGTVFLTTDDCQAAYEELKARGVEFTETPEERPYGIDCGFRDPSGNSLRLTQVTMPPSPDRPWRRKTTPSSDGRRTYRPDMGVTGLEPVTSSLSSWRSPN